MILKFLTISKTYLNIQHSSQDDLVGKSSVIFIHAKIKNIKPSLNRMENMILGTMFRNNSVVALKLGAERSMVKLTC